jgi:hypothetical protein
MEHLRLDRLILGVGNDQYRHLLLGIMQCHPYRIQQVATGQLALQIEVGDDDIKVAAVDCRARLRSFQAQQGRFRAGNMHDLQAVFRHHSLDDIGGRRAVLDE